MSKLVVLKLGTGSFEAGFPVTLQIGDENVRPVVEITGELPPDSDIPLCYHQWQSIYCQLKFSGRPIGIPKRSPQTPSLVDCEKAGDVLKFHLNTWLSSTSFRPIREKLLEKLLPSDQIRILLQTNDLRLQKLPWHLWDLLERYPQAEIALSAPCYEQVSRNSPPQLQVKVLAILGNSQGIDIQTDSQLLKELPHANTTFLVEPSSKDLTDQLWEQDWQILFFAGHSATDKSGNEGKIDLNQTECLTISQLKYALRKAVERGLHLAIFNSCDGLGLAREFADLHIPQIIVMREPVPDRVAQEFLKYFLEAFARGESLYIAVREARERLQGLESQFPCATWLPVIYQNPAAMPLLWRELHFNQSIQQISSVPKISTRGGVNLGKALSAVILASIVITPLLMGVRYLGLLQSWELMAFDHLLSLRPQEKPDSRILVITVTEEDVQAQSDNRRGSLSDEALDQLLAKLEAYQPRVIGLDIYRDYAVQPAYPMLAERMRKSDRFVAVCQVSNPQASKPGIKPPPEVSPDSLGFSDIVIDADHVVRRHLLALTPPPSSPCTAPYALNVQLTLRYLYAEGIQLQFSPDGAWQLGKLTLKPIEAHTGGYQGIDALGHQILLNYRSFPNLEAMTSGRSLTIAPRITLQQALAGQLQADAVKDKIVLIGTTAESFRDYSLTPYASSQGKPQEIAGVYLQAQMVSQLLSAALDGRPLLWTWNVWGEVIWVWVWAMTGGLLVVYLRQLAYLGLAVGVAFLSLYGFCLILLILYSCWVPFVPAAIALGGSAVILVAVIKPIKKL
ncbi:MULTISPECIES: CHASE2 domain-containing protein [unclassified Nodularia (in: cyanobacteria)]|uniref:CHASE2 domain-containing protein n=1 Tax=unclassified Nodularia (in: cyanobacteria) TaxID=2656917 RepID=UPI00188243CC|nr:MULTISPECIES: CHASE2 domain-containing protein [unclassified Nodularia (in: cyanobacteria)]MBE9199445.1 CHASE2 domain-containing protein [Nodularia sp. LEGE 06071]MCC2692943.1 CHASE2 domain-containing protein [Nodularia sp. LEGE 04288]